MTCVAFDLGHGLIMNWYYMNRLGLNIVRFLREIMRTLYVPALLAVLSLLLYHVIDFYKMPCLLGGIFVFTILFCMLDWLFVLNSTEKQNFLRLVLMRYRV